MEVHLKEGFRANNAVRKQINSQLGIMTTGDKYMGEMVWESCPSCKKQRWVRPNKSGVLCSICNRKSRLIRVDGYEVLSRLEFFERFGIRKRGSQIFYPCTKCGENHWIGRSDLFKKTATGVCRKCFNKYMSDTIGEERWNFNKNYRVKYGHGYIQIRISRDDPYSCMAKNGTFILEHRYVMAKHLGRPLNRWELVHHINCNKEDNSIENLKLVTLKNHHGELICPHCGKSYDVQ